MWREDTVQHRTEKYLLKAPFSMDGEKGSTGTIGLVMLVHMEELENAADSN